MGLDIIHYWNCKFFFTCILFLSINYKKMKDMDVDYINSHLLQIAELLYGKNSECYSKREGKYFIFGSKKKKNKVNKRVALYLVAP